MAPIKGQEAVGAKRDMVFDFGAIPHPPPMQGVIEATLAKA